MRRATGPNLGTLLGVVAVAVLLFKAAELPYVAAHPVIVPYLVGAAVLLVVGYVVTGDLTKVFVALAGVGLLVATEGLSATIELAVVAAALLWLLGAVRGWLG